MKPPGTATSSAETMELFKPFSTSTFFAKYFERGVLYQKATRCSTDYFNITDVEEWLFQQRLTSARVDVYSDGLGRKAPTYTTMEEPVPPHEIENCLKRGSTIRITRIDHLSKQITQNCEYLAQTFKATTAANLYITPPYRKGLNVHYDQHDVIIYQIHGKKLWNFYNHQGEGKELPLEYGAMETFEYEKKPARRLMMKPGDMLYIPRGQLHAAFATDTLSAHVTYGIEPIRVIDLLHRLASRAALEDRRFRRAIYRGNAWIQRTEIHSLLESLGEMVSSPATFNEAIADVAEHKSRLITRAISPGPIGDLEVALLQGSSKA
ncbi:MAG TPA: cupin domain-containing protein [Caulobacteraceae bacterium]